MEGDGIDRKVHNNKSFSISLPGNPVAPCRPVMPVSPLGPAGPGIGKPDPPGGPCCPVSKNTEIETSQY